MTGITSPPAAQRRAATRTNLHSLTPQQQAQLESYQQAAAQMFGITPGALAGPAGGPLTLPEIQANAAELFRTLQ